MMAGLSVASFGWLLASAFRIISGGRFLMLPLGRFLCTKRFRKIPKTSVKNVFHLSHSSHSFPDSLHRPTKRPEIFLNCSAILSNTSFFVALLPNMCLCSAQVVISNRTSSSNHLSRLLLELVGKGSFETAAVKG